MVILNESEKATEEGCLFQNLLSPRTIINNGHSCCCYCGIIEMIISESVFMCITVLHHL